MKKKFEYFGKYIVIFGGQLMIRLTKHLNLVFYKHISHPFFFKTYVPDDFGGAKLDSINFAFMKLVFVH